MDQKDPQQNEQNAPATPPQPAPEQTSQETQAQEKQPDQAQPAVPEKNAKQPEKYTQKPLFMGKPTECAKCGKPVKRRLWYYRAGKYYCTKRCWQEKAKEKAAEAAKPAEGA